MHRIVVLAGLATSFVQHSLSGQAPDRALTRQVFAAESSFAASMARRDLKAFAALVSPEAVFFSDSAALRGNRSVAEIFRGTGSPVLLEAGDGGGPVFGEVGPYQRTSA